MDIVYCGKGKWGFGRARAEECGGGVIVVFVGGVGGVVRAVVLFGYLFIAGLGIDWHDGLGWLI